jgi:pilus assembly protein CpaB
MRRNTFISITLSILLAALAVFATREWLNSERMQIISDNQRVVEDKVSGQIVVASEPLRFGMRLTEDKLKLIDWPTEMVPTGTFTSIDKLVGTGDEDARFVIASIQTDEPILVSRLTIPGQRAKLSTALTPGMKAISIAVNVTSGVAGFILPGDRVDIMILRGGYVDVLLQGVQVLAIDQTVDDRKDKPTVVRTVTFEVTTIEAQKLLLASSVGRLSLALRNLSSSDIQDIERVRISDLSESDAAESLAKEIAKEGEANIADAKIADIEGVVKDVSDTLNDRLNSLEQLISKQETEAEETALVAEKEAILAKIEENNAEANVVKKVRKSRFLTVGVIRGGSRSEYKVKELPPELPPE